MKNGTVLYDFNAEIDSEISVKEGDKIVIIEEIGDGWSTVRHVDSGKEGYIPTAYYEVNADVDVVEPNVETDSSTSLIKSKTSTLPKVVKKDAQEKRNSMKPLISGPKSVVVTSVIPNEDMILSPSLEGEVQEVEQPKIRGKKDSRSPRNPPKINKTDATKLLRRNLKIYLLKKRLNQYTMEKEFKFAKMRNELIRETISTEKTYVNSLKTFVNVFLEPLKRQPAILNEQKQKAIFSNVVQILSVNSVLLSDLEEELEKWPNARISACFKKMAPFLIMYTTYVNNYDTAFQMVQQEQKSNSKFRDFLNEAQKDPQTERHPITSFLIMPVQRIPRYKMLLADIVKNMPDDHIEKKDMSEALEKISHVAVGVNERKRADENSQMLVQLSQTLRTLKNNYNSLVQPNRSMIREGSFKVRCNLKEFLIDEYRAILCTDVLILLQNNPKIKDKKRACYYIFFSFCRMSPRNDEANDFTLEVINDGQIISYNMVWMSGDLEEKNEWVKDIEECIDAQNKANQLKLGSKCEDFLEQATLRSHASTEVKQATNTFQNISKEFVATEKKLMSLDHSLKSNELLLKKLQETIKAQKEELARTEEGLVKLEQQQVEINAVLNNKLAVVSEHDSVFLEALKDEIEAFRVIFGEMPTTSSVAQSILVSATPRRRDVRSSVSYEVEDLDKWKIPNHPPPPPPNKPKPLPNTNMVNPPPPVNKPVPQIPSKPPTVLSVLEKSPITQGSNGSLKSVFKAHGGETATKSWKLDPTKVGQPLEFPNKPLPPPKKLPQTPPAPPKKPVELEKVAPPVNRNLKPTLSMKKS